MARSSLGGNSRQTLGLPIQETPPRQYALDVQNTSSLARGTDQLQASLYGMANVIGGLTGIDVIARFGEEGVLRNLEEAALNPPTIRDWDDVESLADFGTYFLEAVGEQLPQLAVDAATAGLASVLPVPGAGLAAVAARRATLSMVKKAAIGKALKRKVGEKGFSEFLKRRANSAAIGIGISNIAQNTGETQIGFMQRGIDAPDTALISGIVKASLDMLAPLQLLDIAKKTGVPAEQLPELLTRVAKQIGITGGTESITEGAQTMVDFIATRVEDPSFELTSIENLKELREAMIKGGLVGATLGGGLSGLSETAAYNRARRELADNLEMDVDQALKDLQARRDEEEQFQQEGRQEQESSDGFDEIRDQEVLRDEADQILGKPKNPRRDRPIPESEEQVSAQIRAMLDRSSSKDSVLITEDSGQPDLSDLPDNVIKKETLGGLLLTTNAAKAARADQITEENEDAVLGEILYNRQGGKANTDGLAVVGYDADGVPVVEIASNVDSMDADVAEARKQTPAGGSVRVTTGDQVIRDRVKRTGPVPIAHEILQELGIGVEEDTQDSVPLNAIKFNDVFELGNGRQVDVEFTAEQAVKEIDTRIDAIKKLAACIRNG